MRLERHHTAVVLASALTVLAFVGTTVYTQHRLAAVDSLSSSIAADAIPSIEHLARAGIRLQRVRRLIEDAPLAPRPRTGALEEARAELRALNAEIADYLRLAPLVGEGELVDAIRTDFSQLEQAIAPVFEAEMSQDPAAAAEIFRTRAIPAFERASQTLLRTMEFDVAASERLARDVLTVRRATTRNIIVLDVFAAGVAFVAALVALRAARDHDRLLTRLNTMLAERVAELDRFAGRVAHDILSPLDAIGVGLALVSKTADAPALGPYIERSQRALQRVQQLVHGLLRFARAGAHAGKPESTRVDLVLASVGADYTDEAAESGIELTIEPGPPAAAGCSVGVLTSIVQNLVSNAFKYIGTGPQRRVIIRGSVTRHTVIVEVQDTGPGIPASVLDNIFMPFVRGEHENIRGLGLGLATVHKLAQAHGGRVGVRSTAGAGTTFTVALPRAPEPVA